MDTKELQRQDWEPYFNRVSKQLAGKGVKIEILSRDLGAQQDSARRMFGITYDPKDNTFEVITDKLNHAISDPSRVMVQEENSRLRCVDVSGREGEHEIIYIKEEIPVPG